MKRYSYRFCEIPTIITLSTFVIDTVAPTLNETTPINALSNDNTPSVIC